MVGGGGYLGVSSLSWSKHLAEGSICVGDLQQFLNIRNRNVRPQAELTKAPEVHTPMAQFLWPGPSSKGSTTSHKMPSAADKAFKTQEAVGCTLYVNHALWYWTTHYCLPQNLAAS